MIQNPVVVGLMVCQQCIIEEGTKNISLVNRFLALRVEEFPSPPESFFVAALLTDGAGEMECWLVIQQLSSLQQIAAKRFRIRFANPLRQAWLVVRFKDCIFPSEGKYQIMLTANQELIADCVFEVGGSS